MIAAVLVAVVVDPNTALLAVAPTVAIIANYHLSKRQRDKIREETLAATAAAVEAAASAKTAAAAVAETATAIAEETKTKVEEVHTLVNSQKDELERQKAHLERELASRDEKIGRLEARLTTQPDRP